MNRLLESIFRSRSGNVAVVSIAVALLHTTLSGCDPTVATAIEPSGVSIAHVETAADPADPYGACTLAQAPSPYGAQTTYQCSTGGDCTGWGSGTVSCPGNYDETDHMVCDHPCDTDESCPVPGSGTAIPVCLSTVHACELPCDDTTLCPDGYACQSTDDWGVSSSNKLPFMCMQTMRVTSPCSTP
jgi:hypothetical protein